MFQPAQHGPPFPSACLPTSPLPNRAWERAFCRQGEPPPLCLRGMGGSEGGPVSARKRLSRPCKLLGIDRAKSEDPPTPRGHWCRWTAVTGNCGQSSRSSGAMQVPRQRPQPPSERRITVTYGAKATLAVQGLPKFRSSPARSSITHKPQEKGSGVSFRVERSHNAY